MSTEDHFGSAQLGRGYAATTVFKVAGVFSVLGLRRFATRAVALSERIDPEHWEHWALQHDTRCANPRWCTVCGGTICDLELTSHVDTG
jgi:hypothetical protein